MMVERIIIPIVAAVVAGLILDLLLRWEKSVIFKIIKFLIGKFKGKPKGSQNDKLLLYLSAGGTGRDPMAKAITLQLIKDRPLKSRLRVEGMALGPLSGTEVEFAARNAIKELYGKDLLKGYVPRTVTQELLDESDLILVMDHSLKDPRTFERILPKTKTYVFKEFFGLKGGIKDPCPDGRDKKTLTRYKKCALEMKGILEEHVEDLLNALQI